MKGLGHLIKTVNDEVNLAPFNVEKTDVRGIHDIQRNARGMFPELGEHCREEGRLCVVTSHDSDHHLRVAGRKFCGGLHGAVHAQQDVFDKRLEFQRAFRRCHAVRGSDQKRIIEECAKSSQTVTHRGLREAQLIRCLCDIALAQQDLEINQQVQINLVQVFHIMRGACSALFTR